MSFVFSFTGGANLTEGYKEANNTLKDNKRMNERKKKQKDGKKIIRAQRGNNR